MISTNFIKFLAFFALIFSLFSACRFWQKTTGDVSDSRSSTTEELKSQIPFATKEPDNFKAELAVSANGTQRTTFIARRGAARRYDYNFGAENQVTVLQTDKYFLILPGRKIYAEDSSAAAGNFAAAGDWQDFLTTEWLSAKTEAKFEKLETDGNLTKYRVALLDGKTASEILISVDETLGLPVKQEFYSINGEQKSLTFSVELKNLQLQAEDNLFVVPADFKKVAIEEFRKVLRAQ